MSNNDKVTREARLRWVPIDKMRVSPFSQRELNQARVDRLAADFDLEQLGTPTVNMHGTAFHILDGQHRVEALRLIGYGDQQIQCWTYEGLTPKEEAKTFLKLNDTLTVSRYDKYTKAVNAELETQLEIDRVVRAQGLIVSRDKIPGSIAAVATLERVFQRSGSATLGRTLRIIRDAYGDPGFEAAVIDGIGLMCQRYNGDLDDTHAVRKLGTAHAGVSGLLGKAEIIRRQTNGQKNHSVAAAAVEIINSGKGGKKLPSWWKSE